MENHKKVQKIEKKIKNPNDGKSIKITTPKQFEKLVEMMEQNPGLATGFRKSSHKLNIKDEWEKIAGAINKYGPPLRSGEGWNKVWADYKCNLKKKLIHNKSECSATGGGPNNQKYFTPTDEAASNLLQLESIITPKGRTFGAHRKKSNSEYPEQNTTMAVDSENEETCDENEEPSSPQPITNKKNKKNTKNDLLSEQLKVQSDLYIELKRSLAEIERYSRKTFKLKEDKFKLYKNELKEKEKHRKSLIQIRLDELDIKKRKIDLEELRSGFHAT